MRKLSFYPKLAATNLWRNRSTYLPYLLACIVSIITFYTLLAINFNEGIGDMRGDAVVQSFMAIGTIILAIFSVILLFYTNGFLIKRRKKELGLYSVLGMEKGSIAVVMFFETLFIAAIALVAGLSLGVLLARLLYLVLLRLVRFDVMLDLPVSKEGITFTLLFFLFVFFLTLLANLRQVHKTDPLALQAGAKQGEKQPRASWLLTVVGLLTMAAGYYLALRSQGPVEAILLFLLAAFLVIIGTYCLFTSGSVAVLKALRKNKGYYYTPKHFVPTGGLIYRMKQNAVGLASICILSCMVLVTVASTVSLYVGAEDALLYEYPHEVSIYTYSEEDNAMALAASESIAQAGGVQITGLRNLRTNNLYTEQQGTTFSSSNSTSAQTVTFVIMPLEDYNAAEGKSITLEENQALLFCTGGSYKQPSLTLDGIPYQVTPIEHYDGKNFGVASYNQVYYLVLPSWQAYQTALAAQEAATGFPTEYTVQSIYYDLAGTDEAKAAFLAELEEYTHTAPSTSERGMWVSTRDAYKDVWYMTHGGFLFLGIYFGLLFLMATAMIIYYKQISEGYEDRERFEILQKVGMSQKEVRKTIHAQIRTVFYLPLLVAIIHILAAFVPIRRALVLFGVVDRGLLFIACLATILLYALVYQLVYRRTARSYFKIVRRKAN